MVDPSKVKLPKELRKIKSKVAKETKSMSFAKQMKRLKSPKKTQPLPILFLGLTFIDALTFKSPREFDIGRG